MKSRRNLLKAFFSFIFILPFVRLLTSCGDGNSSGVVSGGNCSTGGTSSSISSNHGHTITVSADDVNAGVQKTYNIQGSGNHDHTVTLTASHFSSLQSNVGIQVTSSSSGHTHIVTVNCA